MHRPRVLPILSAMMIVAASVARGAAPQTAPAGSTDGPASPAIGPHRPLFDVRFVLRPAPPRLAAMPAITLDDRPAIRPEWMPMFPSPVQLVGAYRPNVEICQQRECEARSAARSSR